MSLPKPNEPIELVAIKHRPIYGPFDYADDNVYACSSGTETMLSVTTTKDIDGSFFDALFAWANDAGFISWGKNPKPTKAIINDPATVVFFDDGTKVVTKCSGDDEFDPMFGIMACALRKSSRNRERIDMWEPIISYLVGYIWGADDCRILADMLTMTADALDADGVMDAVCDYDDARIRSEYAKPTMACNNHIEKAEPNYERTRQVIRDLVDRGEL